MCGWSKMRSGDRLCILISTLPPLWGLFHLHLSYGDIWRFPYLCHHWIFSRLGEGQRVYLHAAATWLVVKSREAHWRRFLTQPQRSFPGAPATTTMWPTVPACPFFPSPLGLLAPVLLHSDPHLSLPSSQSHYCPKLSSGALSIPQQVAGQVKPKETTLKALLRGT